MYGDSFKGGENEGMKEWIGGQSREISVACFGNDVKMAEKGKPAEYTSRG